jgi:hypothetical protein
MLGEDLAESPSPKHLNIMRFVVNCNKISHASQDSIALYLMYLK